MENITEIAPSPVVAMWRAEAHAQLAAAALRVAMECKNDQPGRAKHVAMAREHCGLLGEQLAKAVTKALAPVTPLREIALKAVMFDVLTALPKNLGMMQNGNLVEIMPDGSYAETEWLNRATRTIAGMVMRARDMSQEERERHYGDLAVIAGLSTRAPDCIIRTADGVAQVTDLRPGVVTYVEPNTIPITAEISGDDQEVTPLDAAPLAGSAGQAGQANAR